MLRTDGGSAVDGSALDVQTVGEIAAARAEEPAWGEVGRSEAAESAATAKSAWGEPMAGGERMVEGEVASAAGGEATVVTAGGGAVAAIVDSMAAGWRSCSWSPWVSDFAMSGAAGSRHWASR